MVLTAQSGADENESSHGRQLPVSKKLSKAISSVNRSRFQKPRPNLLSSKRGDSNVSSSTSNTSKTTSEQDVSKNELSSSSNRKVQSENEVCTPNSNSIVSSENVEDKDIAVLVKEKTAEKVEKSNLIEKTDKTVSEQDLPKPELSSLSDGKVKSTKEVCFEDSNSTDTPEVVSTVISSNSSKNKTSQEVPLVISTPSNKNKTPQEVSSISTTSNKNKTTQELSSVISTNSIENKTTQEVPSVISTKSNKDKTTKEVPSVISTKSNKDKTIQEVPSVISTKSNKDLTSKEVPSVVTTNLNKNKTPQEVSTIISSNSNKNKNSLENATVISTNSNKELTQSSHLEKTIGATTTPSTTSDKSSKYPHLTSILSKKRSEPKREIQQKKRRKFKKGEAAPERSKMTMADLIYWNPITAERPQKSSTAVEEVSNSNIEIEEEFIDNNVEENAIQESVPKLVISEDGQINIDQSSLFVSRNLPQPTVTEVRKDDTTYSSFRKRPLTKHWDTKATRKFYEALMLVGTDFSLMETIFPNRTRRELKQKFKREEKYNIDLINRVLYEPKTFDEDTLKNFMVEEEGSDSGNALEDSEISIKEKKSGKKRKTKKDKKVEADFISESNDSISELNDAVSELNDLISETTTEESLNTKNKRKKSRKNVKKSSKTNDDEDEISVAKSMICDSITERTGSKRKRNTKKLPDDFVSIDSIEESEFDGIVETQEENSTEDAENTLNESTQVLSERENVNSLKVIATEDPIRNEGNYNHVNVIVPQPMMFIGTDAEECGAFDVDPTANLTLLANVMAYEVVTSQAALAKKKRKINPSILRKTQQNSITPHLSSANYTHYTPV